MDVIKSKKVIIVIALIAMLSMAIGYEMFEKKDKQEYIKNDESIEQVSHVEEKIPDIEVYILGCINNPGTYEVKKNTTIKQLAEIAGGFTEGADLEKINLVYKIKDNAMIVIKDKNDMENDETGMKLVKGVYKDDQDDDIDLQVNINTASKDKLTKLPGIGESVAKKIIKYREDNGDFENIEDIMNIPGIGENKFNSIKDMIVIS